jgi:mono/diheme cytochrome c family protein
MHFPRLHSAALAAASIAFTIVSAPALADEGRHGTRIPLLAQYQQECASCHAAYPPALLPAASWRRLVNDLPHHFGTDASLDPAAASQIASWLNVNAGTSRRGSEEPPQDRITRSAWFVRKHREISGAIWKSPNVRSAGNCAACHTTANQGVFNEHDVRIPR